MNNGKVAATVNIKIVIIFLLKRFDTVLEIQ